MNYTKIYSLDTIIELQGMIRIAIVEDDEAAARWLDQKLEEIPQYKATALTIAYDLMRIMKRVKTEPRTKNEEVKQLPLL